MHLTQTRRDWHLFHNLSKACDFTGCSRDVVTTIAMLQFCLCLLLPTHCWHINMNISISKQLSSITDSSNCVLSSWFLICVISILNMGFTAWVYSRVLQHVTTLSYSLVTWWHTFPWTTVLTLWRLWNKTHSWFNSNQCFILTPANSICHWR